MELEDSMKTTTDDVKKVLLGLEQNALINTLINDKDFLMTVAMEYCDYVKNSEGEPNWDLERYAIDKVEWVEEMKEREDEKIVENPSGIWGFRDGVD
jgi:hypothetical protein